MNHRSQTFVHQHFRNAGGVRRESFSGSLGNKSKRRLSSPPGGKKAKDALTKSGSKTYLPTPSTISPYGTPAPYASRGPLPTGLSSSNPSSSNSSSEPSPINRSSTGIGIAALYWCLAGSGCTTIPYEQWEKPRRQEILTVPVKEIDPARYRFNVMCLLVGEFSDLSTTHWRVKFTPEMGIPDNLEFQEPLAYTLAKRNAVVNPDFTDSSGIDRLLLGRRVNLDFDNVRFETFPNPLEIFEFLKSYRGQRLDRLIIYSLGNSQALGQNKPSSFILGRSLLEQYCKADFFRLMSGGGHALLMPCGTNEDYTTTLTIGEVISWLLQIPVTGATKEDVLSIYTIYAPNMAKTVGVEQHDTDLRPLGPGRFVLDLSVPFILSPEPTCKVIATAHYVTIRPMSDEQLKIELSRQQPPK